MKSAKNQLSKVAKKKDFSENKISANDPSNVWNISSKVEIIRELSEADQNQFEGTLETELTKLLKNEELVEHESTDSNSEKQK